ncbi:uncharacterized protein E0L32_005961 [Thyridium curvatum]|uniref:Serine/threonine-protein phosphatase 2A activator n=1 Tax=Thyridium curvatum TaxID=1093900 RepID=A0A507BAF3_9PEZI|nr:uncharacterized protein E0L32_005961 [Thyridium curvatum]TPX13758.1 hypothetical protein E0L32_005961 [Thyridium curvatum]
MDPPPAPSQTKLPPPPPTTATATTTMPAPPPPAAPVVQTPRSLPRLEILDPSKPHAFSRPSKRINEGADVAHFSVSLAYRDIGLFLMQLNHAVCPRRQKQQQQQPPQDQQQSQQQPPQSGSLAALRSPAGRGHAGAVKAFTIGSTRDPPPVKAMQALLERAGALVDDAPPDPGPRRFGNVAFRTWHRLLEDRVDGLLREHVGEDVLSFGRAGASGAAGDSADGEGPATALDELRAYFLGGFGSCQRLDYGTGHELSFFAFLGCLWKLGFFGSRDASEGEELERSIVLGVIEPYLVIVRRLIQTYTLEPAGSHGVWGLDDHSFMPYIFGSAQLAAPLADPADPVPQAGSLPRAPRPGDITKDELVAAYRGEYMYFSAVGFIDDVKTGPFWEHSPVLYDVSGVKDGWAKINKGMLKMYDAEVLAKFPVVQHFPFGSLFSWARDPAAAARAQSVHLASQPVGGAPPPPPSSSAGAGGAGRGGGGPGMAAMPGVNQRGVVVMPGGSSSSSSGGGGGGGGGLPAGQDAGLACAMGRPGTTGAQVSLTKAPWAK